MKKPLFLILISAIILVSGCTADDSGSIDTGKPSGGACIQVESPATNPETGECIVFPTPCNVPEGWKIIASCPGTGIPSPDKPDKVPAAPLVHRLAQPDGSEFCAILVGDENWNTFYLAECDLTYDEQMRSIEIYKGDDGYWKHKSDDTLIAPDADTGGHMCIQVITPAKNPSTGECREFRTPCDVPQGWMIVENCL
ncbi:MAG: hypothetical protein ABIG84_04715 [archaeon]